MQSRTLRIGSVAAVFAGAVFLWAGSAGARQEASPDTRGALVGQLRENVRLQERQIEEAKVIEERIGGLESPMLDAIQRHAEALELLVRVSGEGRMELLKARERVVELLESRLSTVERHRDLGLSTAEDVARLSQALAEARVAVFELRR